VYRYLPPIAGQGSGRTKLRARVENGRVISDIGSKLCNQRPQLSPRIIRFHSRAAQHCRHPVGTICRPRGPSGTPHFARPPRFDRDDNAKFAVHSV